MAITQAYELDGVTVGATPISLVSGTTTVNDTAETGVFSFRIDAGNMAKADQYKVVISETVEATGGTRKTFLEFYLLGVQTRIHITPGFLLMHGWNCTIEKVAGTDRAFDASVLKIA